MANDEPTKERIDVQDPEVVLVAGGLITPALAAEAARYVLPEDFFDKRLGIIWGALTKMLEAGVKPDAIDVVTVASKCAKSAATQRKIAIYASDLLDVFPKFSSLVNIAVKVHRRATMRLALTKMRELAVEIKEQLEAPSGDVEQMESKIAHLSLVVSERQDDTLRRTHFKDMVKEVGLYFDQLATGPSPTAIPTGIATLDFRLGGGLRPGNLHAILGCTGSGKTALASQICDNAEAVGKRAILFSMEVDSIDIYIRDVERTAGRSRWDLRSHVMATREAAVTDLVMAQGKLMNAPGKVVYSEPLSVEGIRQVVLTEMARNGPVAVVAVDHAQVALPNADDKRSMPRYLEVKSTAEGLRRLARQLGVAVVLTAQMNPPAKGEKPRMALVRESKDINNTAEVVLIIWHDQEEGPDGAFHTTGSYIIAEKVRAGQAGRVKVTYNGRIFKFTDVHEVDNDEVE